MNDWTRAEEHAEKARRYYQAGQWEKALVELQSALAVDPEQGDWHFGMGLTLDALQRFDEAAACFEKAWKLRGDDMETMLHLAVDLIRADQCDRAIQVLERMADLDPECESAYCYRIAAYAQKGDHDMAEVMFYLARQHTDECPVCLDHLALSLSARREWERALWCWQQVLRLDPQFPGVYVHLAQVRVKQGRWERAAQDFQQHLRQEPGDLGARLELGQLLRVQNRWAQAAEQFRRVLEFDPQQPQAHLHLGELALREGHLDAAARELAVAQHHAPDLPGLHLRLAQLEYQHGRREPARRLALEEPAAALSPDLALELGRLLIDLQLPGPVPAILQTHLEHADERGYSDELRAMLLRCRGVAHLCNGDREIGLRDCRRAHRLCPGQVPILVSLALAELHGKRWRRARCWMQKALRLAPRDADLRRLRRRYYQHRLSAMIRRPWPRRRG